MTAREDVVGGWGRLAMVMLLGLIRGLGGQEKHTHPFANKNCSTTRQACFTDSSQALIRARIAQFAALCGDYCVVVLSSRAGERARRHQLLLRAATAAVRAAMKRRRTRKGSSRAID